MKKIFIFFTIFLLMFFTGCTMSNTPTKKVEEFLNKYRNLDSLVIDQMDDIVSSDSLMNEDERNRYKDVLRRQYQDLTFEIKDEVIDADKSTVTAEIEVYDYYKVTKDSATYYSDNLDKFKDEEGNLDNTKYIDYRIDELNKTNDRVKYTIDFTLSKVDKIWKLDDIDDATRQKIHGLYSY